MCVGGGRGVPALKAALPWSNNTGSVTATTVISIRGQSISDFSSGKKKTTKVFRRYFCDKTRHIAILLKSVT